MRTHISKICDQQDIVVTSPNFHPVPCSLSLFPCFSCYLLLLFPLQSISLLLPSLAFSWLFLPSPACTLYLCWWPISSPSPSACLSSLASTAFSCLYLVSVVVYNFPLSPAACLSFPAALPWPLCHWRPAQSRLTDGPPTVSPTLQESCRVKQLRTSYPQKIQG